MNKMKMIFVFGLIFVLALAGCSQGTNEAADDQTSENQTEEGSQSEETDDTYPEKPINWVVGYPASSPADTTTRLMAKYAEKYLPNNGKFVVVNKPGAAGTIGMTEVYNAEPDGYTIGTSAMAALAIKPQLGETEYEYDEFQPIMNYIDAQQLIFVKWDSPWKTVDDLVEYAKEHPGEVKYSTSGAMNAVVVSIERFAQQVGIELEAVAYEGEPDALNALLRGDVALAGINGANTYQYFESEEVRPLFNYTGVSAPFTDTPTLKELGYDLEATFFNGILTTKGTPMERVNILLDAFQQALDDPELQAEFEKRGLESNPKTLDEFQDVITDLYNANTEVLKNMGAIE